MGIASEIKQVSPSILEIFKTDPLLLDVFFCVRYLPESEYWNQLLFSADTWTELSQNDALQEFKQFKRSLKFKRFKWFKWIDKYDWEGLKAIFLQEWIIPELDLDKNWEAIHFLLTGYGAHSRPPFLVNNNYTEDNLPLVNAVLGGTGIGRETGYGKARYLLPNEVAQVATALIALSESGYRARYQREAFKENRCGWIDWSDKDYLDTLTEYYNEMTEYYKNAANKGNIMLLYLI